MATGEDKSLELTRKKLMSEMMASSLLTKKQSDLISNFNNNIELISDLMVESQQLEEVRKDLLLAGNYDLVKVASDQQKAYKDLLNENRQYVSLIDERNSLEQRAIEERAAALDLENESRMIAGKELIKFGKENSLMSDISADLNDKLTGLVVSNQYASKALDEISVKAGPKLSKSLLAFGVSLGTAATLFQKYESVIIASTVAFPAQLQKAGFIEKMATLGTMSFKTGLTIDELGKQMQQNRVAWQNNSKEIVNFIDDNEQLRLRLGMTREEFADNAATATQFLKRQGVDQAHLSESTKDYMINLNKVAIQTGRQAKEVEESRRQAKIGAAGFLAGLNVDAKKAFENTISQISDSGSVLSESILNIMKSGDVGERMKAAQDFNLALQQLGSQAGLSADELNKYQSISERAALGDKSAAEELIKMNTKVSAKLREAEKSGALVTASFGGINDVANSWITKAYEQVKAGDAQGQTFDELRKSANNAAMALNNTSSGADKAESWFTKFMGMMPAIGDAVGVIVSLGTGFSSFVKFLPYITKAFGLLGGPIAWGITALSIAIPLIIANWDTIKEYLGKFGDWMGNIFGGVADFSKKAYSAIWDFIDKNLITPLGNIFSGIGSSMVDGIKSILPDWAKNLFNVKTPTATVKTPTAPVVTPVAAKAVPLATPSPITPSGTVPITPTIKAEARDSDTTKGNVNKKKSPTTTTTDSENLKDTMNDVLVELVEMRKVLNSIKLYTGQQVAIADSMNMKVGKKS